MLCQVCYIHHLLSCCFVYGFDLALLRIVIKGILCLKHLYIKVELFRNMNT